MLVAIPEFSCKALFQYVICFFGACNFVKNPEGGRVLNCRADV